MYPNKHVQAELRTMQSQQMSKKASKKIDKEARFGFFVAIALFAVITTFAIIAS